MSAVLKSHEEDDLYHRSKKKVRPWETTDTSGSKTDTAGVAGPQVVAIETYKEKLMNLFGEEVPEKIDFKALQGSKELDGVKNIGTGIEIPLTNEEWDSWSKPYWSKTLVVKVKMLESFLQRRWIRNGTIHVVDMADGFFLFYSSSDKDYDFALFEGPWMIQDHYLQRWRPFFLQSAEISGKAAVWLRIPKLPLELYNAQFLNRIGSSLGTMLKIDRLTSIHSRGKFARICVEMDLSKPLVSHIIIRGYNINLEYEGLHQICFDCGCYGHRAEDCKQQNVVAVPQGSAPDNIGNQATLVSGQDCIIQNAQGSASGNDTLETKVDTVETDMIGFGPWMVPKRVL